MATKTNSFHQFAAIAIGELFDKGYLLNPLDWDVKAQKYTLRIRGIDQKPMVAVGLITFSARNNKIIVYDAVTGEKDEFVGIEATNRVAYLAFICAWAQRLRETAAYK
jgi:hypothetical protein